MHKTPEITRLIHDNFWIVVSFAVARPRIAKVVDEKFLGEWKYLNKSIHEFAEIRADRALLEMEHNCVCWTMPNIFPTTCAPHRVGIHLEQ